MIVKFPVTSFNSLLNKTQTELFPVTIESNGKGKLLVSFGFCRPLVDEFKNMAGAQWMDGKKTPIKGWLIDDSARNRFRMDAMRWQGTKGGKPILGERNPYERYDLPMVQVPCPPREFDDGSGSKVTPYYAHQREGVEFIVTRRQCILAWDMGCVTGDSLVHVSRSGKSIKMTARELYRAWHGLHGRLAWKDSEVKTTIRSMVDGGKLRQHPVTNVLDKNVRPVVLLKLKTGRQLRLTPDHEVATSMDGQFKATDCLKPGDLVVANGQFVDKDGYVRVFVGLGQHHRCDGWGYVYEHILIMESHLGRPIVKGEEVHHKNRIRHDNRPDNLEVLPTGDHKREHDPGARISGTIGRQGGEIWLAAEWDVVESVTPAGEDRVYDVVCADPHRNFVANGIVVHNSGKTLVVGTAMEWAKDNLGWADDFNDFWYVVKKGALYEVQLGYLQWQVKVRPRFLSYDDMRRAIETWPRGKKPPKFVVFDESTQIKSPTALRSLAALHLGDSMRAEHRDPFVVCMTGTPSPKNPPDWWMQCEVACPGFLREGDWHKFRRRLSIIQKNERSGDGGIYNTVKKDSDGNPCWYDDERRCLECGEYPEHVSHKSGLGYKHGWKKSINEVLLIDKRLQGFVSKKFKKDCLDLPERIHVIKRCRATQQARNAAQLIAKSARGAADALTKLRELSDGFQYQDVATGQVVCPMCAGSGTMLAKMDPEAPGLPPSDEARTAGRLVDYEKQCDQCQGSGEVDTIARQTVRVPCPKDDVLEEIIEEHDDIGRLAVYCGFTGSVDRVVDVFLKNDWSVIRVDGRGWRGFDKGPALLPADGKMLYHAFRFGQKAHQKLAFVAQASSAAHGLNFDCTPTIVNYSRDFHFENALQGAERNMRGRIADTLKQHGRTHCTLIDIVHLPSDDYILENHDRKRRLQALTLGEVIQATERPERVE